MDKVVHFEIPADDLARAKKFYIETFGWGMDEMPEMNYTIVRTTEVDETTKMPKAGGINGGMYKRNEMFPVPTFAIDVADIDVATEKIKANGGVVVKEKVAVGSMGFLAYFKDTEGNVLSVWQNAK